MKTRFVNPIVLVHEKHTNFEPSNASKTWVRKFQMMKMKTMPMKRKRKNRELERVISSCTYCTQLDSHLIT